MSRRDGGRGSDRGVRLRDLDGDGRCELLVANAEQNAAFAWSENARRWRQLPLRSPGGRRIVDTRAAGRPACGSSTSTRTAATTSSSRIDESYGVYLFDSMETGWSRRVMAGKRGRPGRPAEDRRGTATNNGLLGPLAPSLVAERGHGQAPRPRRPPPFNELLKDVEPRGKSPEASRKSIRVRPGFRVELMAGEPLVRDPIAFDWGADGKLWVVEMGDYPLGVDGKGKPGGVVKFLEDLDGDGRYDKATRLPRRPALPDRRDALAQGGARRLRAGDLLRRGHRRRRQGRRPHAAVHGVRRGEPAASRQRLRLRPGQLGLRRQRRQRRRDPLGEDRHRRSNIARARLPVPARRRPVRADERPDAVRPASRRLGRLVRQQQQRLGLAFRPGRPRPAPEPEARRRPTRTGRCSNGDRRALPRSAGPLARFNDPDAAGQRHLGEQPDALPRRPVRRRASRGPCSSASRSTTSSAGSSSSPTASRFRAGAPPTRPTASSSPRPTTGSARRCSGPGRTGASGSPTCTGRSSSIPSGSPTTGEAKIDLRAGARPGPDLPGRPRRRSPPADPPARPPRRRRPRRRARQPQRLAARHRPAPARPGAATGRPSSPLRRLAPRRSGRRPASRPSGRSKGSAA